MYAFAMYGDGLPASTALTDFVALDFETANESRDSVCAVGIAVVQDGRIRTGSTLINPQQEFAGYHTGIHGISARSVKDAPTFPELWPELAEVLADQLIVAHVASFDIGALRASISRYELQSIDAQFACTWRLARRIWQLPSLGLSYLAKEFNIELDHHDAGSDAAACAQVMLREIASQNVATPRELFDHFQMEPGDLSWDSGPNSGITLPPPPNLNNLDGNPDADLNHPLHGKSLCFTGTMFSMTRKEAAGRIVHHGASFKSGVSKKTDYLVIGDADFYDFANGQPTEKMQKAAQLKANGDDIEIVAERDFLRMLTS